MNHVDPHAMSATGDIGPGRHGHLDPGEWERLAHALTARFAPHAQAAAAAVREAEHDLATAREELSRARRAAEGRHYQSDRLVFMRASVKEEVEALGRKTTEKKVRVAFRHLVARAVELAEGEVKGYHADQASAQREREHSVEARIEGERQAIERLDSARAMQARVRDAEQAARQGLAVMVEKLASQAESRHRPDDAQGGSTIGPRGSDTSPSSGPS
jgi:hypothetical protein